MLSFTRPRIWWALPPQLGHQAAACNIGTINWKRIFGEEAFKLRGPLYFSDIDKKLAKKRIDHDELEKRAIEYAKVGGALCSVEIQ